MTDKKVVHSDCLKGDFAAGFWRLKHWGLSVSRRIEFIEGLLDLGISTMDHAFVYGSEALFGEALQQAPALRTEMTLISKFGIRAPGFPYLGARSTPHYDSSKVTMLSSVEQSLKSLNTDYLDVLLIHRPDYLMNVDEVCEAFSELKRSGKVRFFGVSNFSKEQFGLIQSRWSDGLITNQVECSPSAMQVLESGVLEQCQKYNIRPMFWSCLGGGILTQAGDAKVDRIRSALQLVAEEFGGVSIEQVIYAWIRALPCNPVVLLGSGKIERVREAVASKKIVLNREQWYSIWQAANGAPVP